jgi:hypothetical protein
MFAIAFDLVVAETQLNHPKGVAQAYSDIRDTLTKFEFDWVQGRSLRQQERGYGEAVHRDHGVAKPSLVSAFRARHPGFSRGTMVRFHAIGEVERQWRPGSVTGAGLLFTPAISGLAQIA